MNPYLPSTDFLKSLTLDGPVVLFPVRIRVAIGVAVTLMPLVIFGTNPELAIAHPTVSLLTAVSTAFLLGLMPTGYGKSDGSMGLWILFVTVSFSMLVWQQSASAIHPVERTSAFLLCLFVFGFGLGILLVGVYAVARQTALWVSRLLVRRRQK